MKKRILFALFILILAVTVLGGIAVAKDKTREVYLQGEMQEDGTIVYEDEEGSQIILGTW